MSPRPLSLENAKLEILVVSICALAQVALAETATPSGMVWIPGGEFALGTDEKEAYPAERSTTPQSIPSLQGSLPDSARVPQSACRSTRR